MNTRNRSETSRLRFKLKSMQWLLIQRERELLLAEAKGYSFVAESHLLQSAPIDERPVNYLDDLHYVHEQIGDFRHLFAAARERYVTSRHQLHQLLAEVVSEPALEISCLGLVELPLPALPGPPDLKTQEQIFLWLRSTEENLADMVFQSVVDRDLGVLIDRIG